MWIQHRSALPLSSTGRSPYTFRTVPLCHGLGSPAESGIGDSSCPSAGRLKVGRGLDARGLATGWGSECYGSPPATGTRWETALAAWCTEHPRHTDRAGLGASPPVVPVLRAQRSLLSFFILVRCPSCPQRPQHRSLKNRAENSH